MFKIGDVVELKSGGPPMTVSRDMLAHEQGECVWFDFEGTGLHRGSFPAVTLRVVDQTDDARKPAYPAAKPQD